MSVIQMPIQLNIPVTALIFENHPNTFDEPALTPMYESSPSYSVKTLNNENAFT